MESDERRVEKSVGEKGRGQRRVMGVIMGEVNGGGRGRERGLNGSGTEGKGREREKAGAMRENFMSSTTSVPFHLSDFIF